MLGRGHPLKKRASGTKKEAPLVERPPFVCSVYCYDYDPSRNAADVATFPLTAVMQLSQDCADASGCQACDYCIMITFNTTRLKDTAYLTLTFQQ